MYKLFGRVKNFLIPKKSCSMNLEWSYSTGEPNGTEKKRRGERGKISFIVGIVRYFRSLIRWRRPISQFRIYRRKENIYISAKTLSNIKERITKVTEERLLAKAANIETKRKTLETSINKKSTEISNDKVECNINKWISFAPYNHKLIRSLDCLKNPYVTKLRSFYTWIFFFLDIMSSLELCIRI